MSAELLRRAADPVRAEWGSETDRRRYPDAQRIHLTVAEWLDFTAAAREAIDMVAARSPERAIGDEASKCFTDMETHALNVARAYLGES